MTEVRVVDPHTDAEVKAWAISMGISPERAKYIEHQRVYYICQEYDYVKEARTVESGRGKLA